MAFRDSLRLGARSPAIALVTIAALYCALAVMAAVPSLWGFLSFAVAVAAAEAVLIKRTATLEQLLEQVAAGTVLRALTRGLLLVVFSARTAQSEIVLAATATVLVTTALRAARHVLVRLTMQLRRPPLLSRNVPIEEVRIPRAPQRRLLEPDGLDALVDLPAVIAVAAGASGSAGPAAVGLFTTVLVTAFPVLLLTGHLMILRRNNVREAVPREVRRQLRELRPEVVLYFGGARPAVYQVEMWLEPVEKLPHRAVLIVRDPEVLASLGLTSLPVVCAVGSMAQLDFSHARVVLYVSSGSNNIPMLAHRGPRSVFVGHGDSDKTSSYSPFSRVYDEVWVAGPIGRERYGAAGVGVPDDRIVEVGRPQLPAAKGPTSSRRDIPRTILYAPTWEGSSGEPYHSSLTHVGPALIKALVAQADLRVLYRPHPLTGSNSRAARVAHEEILQVLRGAGATGREAVTRPVPAAATTAAGSGDLLDLARDTGLAPTTREAYQSAVAAWTEEYWDAAPADRHRIITAPAPDLFSCFNVTDALIADISGVLSDFLAWDRPYAVVNAAGHPADDFHARHPTSTGGVLIGPDLDGLDSLLVAARGDGDPTAAARREARDRLLGTRTDPLGSFRHAVERLCAVSPPKAVLFAETEG